MQPSTFLFSAFLLAGLMTCSSCRFEPVEPTSPAERHEVTPVTDEPTARAILWSADEQYIYAIGPRGFQRISVGSSTVATLDARYTFYYDLSLSGTGTSLYFRAAADSFSTRYDLLRFRINDGILDTMATNVNDYLASPVLDDVVYTPAGTDAPMFYSPTTGTRRSLGSRIAYAFSPDGMDLLTQHGYADYGTYYLYHLADGSETALSFQLEGYFPSFDWTTEGLLALTYKNDEGGARTNLYNLTTGFADTMYGGESFASFIHDATGRRIGYWTDVVTDYVVIPLMGSIPTKWDFIANVYTFATRTVHKYTIGNTGSKDPIGGLAFSPSGTRLACAYRGSITVVNVE